MSTTGIFGGGVPTAPDVKTLVDLFGIPVEGAIVSHGDLAEALGIAQASSRYRTIIEAWRRKLRDENNVLMVAERGVGFVAAAPSRRLTYSKGKISSGFRSVRRGSTVARTTDRSRLTDDEKAQQDKLALVHSQILLAQKTAPAALPSGL